jgi:hypothetical protein
MALKISDILSSEANIIKFANDLHDRMQSEFINDKLYHDFVLSLQTSKLFARFLIKNCMALKLSGLLDIDFDTCSLIENFYKDKLLVLINRLIPENNVDFNSTFDLLKEEFEIYTVLDINK